MNESSDEKIKQGTDTKFKSENNLYIRDSGRYSSICNKKNWLYYFFVVLVSICSLLLCYYYFKVNSAIATDVFGNLDLKYIGLIIAIVVLEILIISFVDYFLLYLKTKKHKFLSVLSNNIKMKFYDCMSLLNSNKYVVCECDIAQSGVDIVNAVEYAGHKKVFKTVSTLIYSFFVILIGTILYYQKVNMVLLIIATIEFAILAGFFITILAFMKNKNKCVGFVAKLCKILYKCHLIKDYETLYLNIVDKLFVYSKTFKQNPLQIFFQILCNMVVLFLKGFIVFVLLMLLNFDLNGVLFEVLYYSIILELVINFLPLPKGTPVFELLFVLLFKNIFFDGYVFYGLLLYRVIDFYLYIVVFGISCMVSLIGKKIKNKNRG